MLTVKRLKGSLESYYEEAVISGVEDYYADRLEATGRWLGTLAGDLGLAGRVDRDDLTAVLDDRDPNKRTRLGLADNRKIRGFDLCFKAPKSVSILWAFAEPQTVRAVEAAHDAAVDAAVGWLERQAAWTRTGHNGVGQRRTDGFVAAAFRHRTSREQDMLLHTHVLVANSTIRHGDEHWRTLDGRHLYAAAKTAGYLYQAELRHQLTQRLEVAWGPVVKGSAELDGVEPALVRLFSKRRAQIEARLAETGGQGLRAGDVAAMSTRAPKIRGVAEDALRARWIGEALAAGYEPSLVVKLVLEHDHRALMRSDVASRTPSETSPESPPQSPPADRIVPFRTATIGASDCSRIATELLSPHGLTAHEAIFDRNDVLRAIAERVRDGATIADIERLADAILTHELVAHVGPVALAARGRRGPLASNCYTTNELLALEQRALNMFAGVASTGRHGTAATREAIENALAARPQLSDEQLHVVRRLCVSDRSIDVLVAPAGAGKTTVLGAAREAWAASGITVTGASVAARAAHELQDTAGIRSSTIASLLADRNDRPPIPERSILVIDEAAMVGTRQLHALMVHAARSHARLILVGDDRQLPEIDAGGLFAGLARRLPALTLSTNRRQREAWERAALNELRRGDIDAALRAYADHGRIAVHDQHSATLEHVVADWAVARRQGDEAIMLASRRSDVEQLNRLARAAMRAAGQLRGVHVITAARAFQAGDEIVCLRNNRSLGVTNGSRGVVAGVDPQCRDLIVTLTNGQRRTIPARYLDAGNVDHAYALTVHKSQGLTTERVFAIVGDDSYRELAYTALSRGRTDNRLYITRNNDEWDRTVGDPISDLSNALELSRRQQLATDLADRRVPSRELELGL